MMTTYMILLFITFCIMVTAALIVNYSKQRAGKTRHGLTGMCHESGGEMCSCCSDKYLSTDSRCR